MDRSQMEVGLVVQLYPNQPAGESCSVDTSNNLHDGEAAASVGPHRRFMSGGAVQRKRGRLVFSMLRSK